MECSLERIDLPLSQALGTAAGSIKNRSGWLVRVSEAGRTGIGEALPLPGWTEPSDQCEAELKRAIKAIDAISAPIDSSVDDNHYVPAPYRRLINQIDAPAARHGLSLALLDLRARQRSVPLVELLGGTLGSVPVNATVGDQSPEDTAVEAADAAGAGYRTIKCKVGVQEPQRDRQRISAVRRQVGDDIAIRLDANGAWSTETALDVIDWCKRLDVEYLEQPLPPESLQDFRMLHERDVPIALDEGLYEHGIETVIEAGVCSVAVCKPMVLGGIDRLVDYAEELRRAGIEPVVTTTIDGVVATAGASHAACAINPTHACGLGTLSLFDSTPFAASWVTASDGAITLNERPGIGVDPDGNQ